MNEMYINKKRKIEEENREFKSDCAFVIVRNTKRQSKCFICDKILRLKKKKVIQKTLWTSHGFVTFITPTTVGNLRNKIYSVNYDIRCIFFTYL
jgi:hypothetical protein